MLLERQEMRFFQMNIMPSFFFFYGNPVKGLGLKRARKHSVRRHTQVEKKTAQEGRKPIQVRK